MKKRNINLLLAAAIILTNCAITPKIETVGVSSQKIISFSEAVGKELVLVDVHVGGKNTGFSRKKLVKEDFGDMFTATFDGQMISGVGAPNRFSAPYVLGDEKNISINMIISTRMAAFREPERLKENEYFNYLQKTYKWDIVNGMLELFSKTDNGVDVLMFFMLKS